eukprot:3057715-Rhodomonas_salina.1
MSAVDVCVCVCLSAPRTTACQVPGIYPAKARARAQADLGRPRRGGLGTLAGPVASRPPRSARSEGGRRGWARG